MSTKLATPGPSVSTHSLGFVVPEADIDELGHASNIAYVRWVQEVALSHSTAVGFDFDAYRKLGGIFVVRRQEIDYMRSVLRGEQLQLRTWIDTVMAAKCLRATEIFNAGGTVVARALTTWGYIELESGRPARIPSVVREAFGVAPHVVRSFSA